MKLAPHAHSSFLDLIFVRQPSSTASSLMGAVGPHDSRAFIAFRKLWMFLNSSGIGKSCTEQEDAGVNHVKIGQIGLACSVVTP